jgi:hypothetical protein
MYARNIKINGLGHIYPTNSSTFSFLDPRKKTSSAKEALFVQPEKCTQKNNTFKTNHSDLLVDLLSPYSLKSDG